LPTTLILLAGAFLKSCTELGIEVPLYLSFAPVGSGEQGDFAGKLQQMKAAGVRIIMLAGQVRSSKLGI
jgi:hypothetical protein